MSDSTPLDEAIRQLEDWFASPRFREITRLYSARQVAEQQGTIEKDYPIAREAARGFYQLLREHYDRGESITTFGPYSPGHVVMMKRLGIQGIYLGGWATSAKGSVQEDLGADLASYPLSQVPDEASVLVRALLTQDRNQRFNRSRMSAGEREATPEVDYNPYIIADADTGHGGDAHVRNLIRRFVEAGVPGYHIEDQRPGTKKCGHQGGKVLVSVTEQISRLNTARFQLDTMGVEGIIVARTDAEAANLLDNNSDGRDHPFILGATLLQVPPYRDCSAALLRRFHQGGVDEVNGHRMLGLAEENLEKADAWFREAGIAGEIDACVERARSGSSSEMEAAFDEAGAILSEKWEDAAGLMTYGEAVIEAMRFRKEEGFELPMTEEEWLEFAKTASYRRASAKAAEMGLRVTWDSELARTSEGYYQVRGGIPYAIAKSLAVAPYADLLWMETKTANLEEAREFAEAVHAVYPNQMLAYNLSPSFNWDTTGMTEQEMRDFPKEIGKLGFVFNFITYGGHQIDGWAAEEFTTDLRENGMLALAKLQRRLRLLESPYSKPQSYVGGPRLDAALAASLGRNATTKAMGKGSTEHQHRIQTEVPVKVLDGWLDAWAAHYGMDPAPRARLRPHRASSELIELSLLRGGEEEKVLDVVYAAIEDRAGRSILSIRDQNTRAEDCKRKRLMTLAQLYLLYRYDADAVHYVTPTDDNRHQTVRMQELGLFSEVGAEIGDMIVATVHRERIAALVDPKSDALARLIAKED